LRYFLFLIFIIFIGCGNEEDKKETKVVKSVKVVDSKKEIKKVIQKPEVVIEKIKLKSFDNKDSVELKFKDDKLISKFDKRVVLLFLNDSTLSKEQLSYMKKTKKEFFVVKNEEVLNYFNVLHFPTIIILDKNETKRYDSILPYEVLKIELKD